LITTVFIGYCCDFFTLFLVSSVSKHGLAKDFSQKLFTSYHQLTMSSIPTAATPGVLSVANLLASIQQNSPMAPASTAPEELQATQLLFEDDMNMTPTPLKVDKEGDPGTLGFPGGWG
jgi:hypothetical protein